MDRVLAPWGLYLFRFPESLPVQEVVQQLQSYAAVRYAEPDVWYSASGVLETNPSAQALEGKSGSVLVAVLDTGMDLRHASFAGRLSVNAQEIAGDGKDNDGNGYVDDVHGYDFYARDGDPTGSSGSGAHGTQVAGRVVEGSSGTASILSLRVGPGPSLSLSAIVEAIGYAVNRGAKIINMSFGASFASQAMQEAINFAAGRGVLLVAAAGNGGTMLPSYPAAMPNVVSVAASNSTGQKTSWSSYGGTVDFTAPGESVTTTQFGGGTTRVSGTSFSAPFVAGVAARIWAALPNLTPAQVVERLRAFAKDIYAFNPGYRGLLGSGWIDNQVAVQVDRTLPLQPAVQDPPPSRTQLEAQLASARQEVQQLQGELAAADQKVAAAQQKTAKAAGDAAEADKAMKAAWQELLRVWSNRAASRQEMLNAWAKLFNAFAVQRETQQRLRVAAAEEARAKDARKDVAARLKSANQRVDDLARQLAQLPPALASQTQTHSLLHQLHGVFQQLEKDPLPEGISAGSSEPFFPELSSSSTQD